MQMLIALATAGAALNLAILLLVGRRVRTAGRLAGGLYALANLAFVAALAGVIAPDSSTLAVLFVIPLALATTRLSDWTAPARVFFAFIASAAAIYVAYAFSLTFLSGLGIVAMA